MTDIEKLNNEIEYYKSLWEQTCEHIAEACEMLGADEKIYPLDSWTLREFARLNRAGIEAKFLHPIQGGAGEKISRPVQQLCFQVVREALSNVIRHARAKNVQITIESGDAIARVSVRDDGRGISNGQDEGTGLTGMRERLELMGGTLTVDSHTGRTTVVAEIPEPA